MFRSGIWNQFLSAVASNLITFSYGTTTSWAASNYVVLTSPQSPLKSGPLTMAEGSMVVSLLCMGGLLGTILAVMAVDRYGRKTSLIFLAIPQIISWTLKYIATNVYYLYAARLLSGIVGGGAFILVPIYVSEIADAKVRGTLGSLIVFACNAGVLTGFIIASCFEYYTQIKILLCLPILFLALFNYFPESPEFLSRRSNKVLVEKSQIFYHGVPTEIPMDDMNNNSKSEKENLEKIEEDDSLKLSDFLTPAAKSAMIISIFMSFLNNFCGSFVMLNYTTAIFEEAGSTLTANQSSIVVAFVQLFANLMTIILVEKAGRKLLYLISIFGCIVGLVSMGCFSVFKVHLQEHSWIPMVSFAVVVLMASIGIMPLQYLIMAEILPKKINSAANLISLTLLWGLSFVLVNYYPLMSQEFGMHGCMFLFAGCCVFGAIFTIFKIPETKGKTYEEIQKELE